jgi:hypothetical protein
MREFSIKTLFRSRIIVCCSNTNSMLTEVDLKSSVVTIGVNPAVLSGCHGIGLLQWYSIVFIFFFLSGIIITYESEFNSNNRASPSHINYSLIDVGA